MSTHNICFRAEIRKYQYFWIEKELLAAFIRNLQILIVIAIYNVLRTRYIFQYFFPLFLDS